MSKSLEELNENLIFGLPMISEILPGLYQGGCIDGMRCPRKIDLVVSLYKDEQYQLRGKTGRVQFKMSDDHNTEGYSEIARYVYNEWRNKDKTVLVHCQAGLNRSGFVIAHVLMMEGYTAQEAIQLIRNQRHDNCLFNPHFVKALLEYNAG